MKLDASISAVVTGGASGLGEASARELASQGVKVAIFDLQDEKGEAIAAELGGTFCKVNVADEESVVAGFEKARAANGQERICINCAGIGDALKTATRKKDTGEIVPHAMDRYLRILNVNLIGTFNVLSKSAAGMMSTDPVTDDGERGVIINTGSVAAQDGQIGQVAYSASKGGIVGMTLPIARDLSRDGIRCNTILPGLFETPLMLAAPQKMRDALGAMVPFPSRLGYPPEFASLVRHICENSMLNGEVIRLDGAIRMQPR